jgi:replicative DNA helicase
LVESAAKLSTLPLYLDDSSSLTPRELVARARLYIRRFGVKLICVDYLQLMQAPGRELRERVAAAAGALRQLAKDEQIPVVAVSQLRRLKDLNTRPTMIAPMAARGDLTSCLILWQQITDDSPVDVRPARLGRYRR